MEFSAYQRAAKLTDQMPLAAGDDPSVPAMTLPLLGLAGEVGTLLTHYKRYIRDGEAYTVSQERIKEELGDILWNVANIASKLKLDLDGIAAHNLQKIADRWHSSSEHERGLKLFDERFPTSERLPRMFEVQVKSVTGPQGKKVIQLWRGGQPFGDKLTDNRREDDGYRLHDVFHLAFAAMLGWSPVLRGRQFFDCKRRSDPITDEVEDGGRAAVIEEAIAALIFAESQKNSMFDGVSTVEYGLLRTIKELTQHLEVSVVTSKQWEETILKAFSIWRKLRESEAGVIRGNLKSRTIEFDAVSAVP